jgi:hypothetical protein
MDTVNALAALPSALASTPRSRPASQSCRQSGNIVPFDQPVLVHRLAHDGRNCLTKAAKLLELDLRNKALLERGGVTARGLGG